MSAPTVDQNLYLLRCVYGSARIDRIVAELDRIGESEEVVELLAAATNELPVHAAILAASEADLPAVVDRLIGQEAGR